MSWSVNAIGRAHAVAAKVDKELANSRCSEPEETLKGIIGSAIAAALAAFPSDYAVKVVAMGSQSCPSAANPEEKTNSLSLTIEPIWGFVS